MKVNKLVTTDAVLSRCITAIKIIVLWDPNQFWILVRIWNIMFTMFLLIISWSTLFHLQSSQYLNIGRSGRNERTYPFLVDISRVKLLPNTMDSSQVKFYKLVESSPDRFNLWQDSISLSPPPDPWKLGAIIHKCQQRIQVDMRNVTPPKSRPRDLLCSWRRFPQYLIL